MITGRICIIVAAFLCFGCATVPSNKPPESALPKIDCDGGPKCKSNCRDFGGAPGNQLCQVYCANTGDYVTDCQTSLGECPVDNCKSKAK